MEVQVATKKLIGKRTDRQDTQDSHHNHTTLYRIGSARVFGQSFQSVAFWLACLGLWVINGLRRMIMPHCDWLTSSAPSPESTILTPIALIFRDMRNIGVLARMVVVSYVSTMRITCPKTITDSGDYDWSTK